MDKTTKKTLPVKLTDDEVAVRAQELAEAAIHAKDCEISALDAAEGWKEEKKRLENITEAARSRTLHLGRIVKHREEQREVDCVVKVENSQYLVIRKDTGEVVVQRAATEAERQASLFDNAGEAVDDAIEAAKDAALDPEGEDVPELEPEEDGPEPGSDQ